MAKKSVKHLQISKDQSTVLVIIAVVTAFVVFGLFGTKALISKGLYQNRALSARRNAAADLKQNYSTAQTLLGQYKVFAEQNPNILGGNSSGTGSLDGDNARIVLDALPSAYDAPALGSSVEKILTSQNVSITSISVTDDPTTNSDQPEANPQSNPISFSFAGSSSYAGITTLLQTFEHSIRPFDITNLQITGTDQNLSVTAKITTYYQPAKSLDLSVTKEVQ